MDRISHLPEHLLLRILSFLPSTKDVVATMVLSKRWQFLWTLVPRLVYDGRHRNITKESFSRFVDRSLLLHEAPVLDYLQFRLGWKSSDVDNIGVWARAVARRHVRELVIEIDGISWTDPATIPKSLYTVSGMLVKLKLENLVLVDDVASPVSFSSLKILSLVFIEYAGGDEYVNRLLTNCPVLEEFYVDRCLDDNVTIFCVRVPTLKILGMSNLTDDDEHSDEPNGVVIDASSLETFTILDRTDGFCVLEKEMHNIVKADIDIMYNHSEKILCSITPVKDLLLCLSSSKDAYPSGCVFHCLVKFTLCRCERQWLNLLMCVLRDSPKLRVLKLVQKEGSQADQPNPSWSEPSSVPECLLSSLETLEWEDYEGTKEEKKVVEYILRKGRCLKKVTISSKPTDSDKKLEMIKELALSFRRSPICQLVFN
ncbi:putative FBD-associated F-box protein [Raphanus sativus]|uniref:Probable FBD-associated F-box protein At1g32375 n=1 Tax=Raphanus sativus TaxID=3726 RepID=A0A6J0MJ84_RAPSA|nr:probable FBD-associated F-box protein At1g32375 [Raphanus sativus]KAJ4905709.1 putative FBD-associated F-box protein [Raphanus sativus]